MGTPKEPKPTKYFVALLSSDSQSLSHACTDLVRLFGAIDEKSEVIPWTASKFYEREMGSALHRGFVAFAALRSPGELATIKLQTQAIEEGYRSRKSGGRRVNLDPGYLDLFKVVLASTKNASQRVYLERGIYAEATLFYYDGQFHGLPYTYADYLWPETLAFLSLLRSRYLEQLRWHRMTEY